MAEDAVGQLCAVYPPAKTALKIENKVEDPTGKALIRELRHKGFEVYQGVAPEDKAPLPTYYVLDQLGKDTWRLTIGIGKRQLSRPYHIAQGALVVAAGSWTYKE